MNNSALFDAEQLKIYTPGHLLWAGESWGFEIITHTFSYHLLLEIADFVHFRHCAPIHYSIEELDLDASISAIIRMKSIFAFTLTRLTLMRAARFLFQAVIGLRQRLAHFIYRRSMISRPRLNISGMGAPVTTFGWVLVARCRLICRSYLAFNGLTGNYLRIIAKEGSF